MSDSTPQETGTNITDKPQRLYYLDWLRVLAMLSIFLYHSDRLFDFEGWHVKNGVTNLASSLHISFFTQWMMPLFFIISGAAVYYALKFRTAGRFAKERVLRILIPFVVFGFFRFSIPQIYLDRLTNSQFTGNFFQFIPLYFKGVDQFGGNFAWHGQHLWYLLYLFIFSLILLPLFLPKKKTGKSLITRFSRLFEHPVALFLLFVPIVAIDIFVDATGMGFTRATGGWSIFSYLLLFILGYLIYSNTKIQETIDKYKTVALIIAIITSIADIVLMSLVIKAGLELNLQPTFQYYLFIMVRGLRVWCWIIAILGFAKKYLNSNKPFLGYANEAVLPFYILHQFIILIIGFFVVQLNLATIWKYLIVVVSSFAAIMLLYHFVIKRFNGLRFLFGMRLHKKEKK